MRRLLAISVFFAIGFGVSQASADPIQLSSTTGAFAHQGAWGPDAGPAGANIIYGQSFVVPQGEGQTTLTDWQVDIGSTASTGNFNFKFYLYAWDPANKKVIGAPIYTSPTPLNNPGGGQISETPPLPIPVTEGAAYILAFSAENGAFGAFSPPGPTGTGLSQAGVNDSAQIHLQDDIVNPSTDFTDPTFHLWQFQGNTTNLPGNAWAENALFGPGNPGPDIGFILNFDTVAPVPETSHVLLAAVAGLAVAGFVRRRYFTSAAA